MGLQVLKESQDLPALQVILEQPALLDLRALQGQQGLQELKESQDLLVLQVIREPLALLDLKD